MIEVVLPDGTIAEFPDSMTNAQIETVLAAQYKPDAPITGGDITRAGLQGATFGFGDELTAGVSAAAGALGGQGDFSDLYNVTRESERQRANQFAQQHPIASGAAEIGGGLMTGALGGIKAAGTGVGRRIAANVASKGLLGRAGAASGLGALGGGTGGAIAGAGYAEEKSDIPAEMVRGGLIGAGTGAVAGPLLEGATSGIRAGSNAIRRARNPQLQAAKTVERAIQRTGLTPDEALERSAAMGSSGTLAESGDAAKRALENATQQEGPARDMALSQLRKRSIKQGSELLEDLGPGRKYETLDSLQEFRKTQAAPKYKEAYEKGVEHTQALEDVFNSLEEFSPGFWNKSKRLGMLDLANEGTKVPENALGTLRPSLRGWQFIKQQLDDASNAAYGRRRWQKGKALNDTKAKLLKELDRQNKPYEQARAMWAGQARFAEMMDSADKFMTISPAKFENAVKKLAPIDKEAVRISAIQAIEDRIQRGQWTHDVAKLFRTPAMERKMRVLFDNAADFAKFQNKITASTIQQSTYDAVRGQSATARRLAAAQEGNDWIAKLLEGVQSPKSSAIGAAARRLDALRPSMSEQARTATAELLLEQNPATRQLNMLYGQGLLNAPVPRPQIPLLPGGTGGLLGGGAAMGLLE